MNELLNVNILPVLLTLGCFYIGQLVQKKTKSALCNPILVAVILVLFFNRLTGLTNEAYSAGTGLFSWLLTPATICLAIPMYEQFGVLKKNLKAIAAGVAAGSLACLTVILLFSMGAGFHRELTVSLLPKSVTTAIGVPLSQLSGGIPSITTAAIVITGILASVLAPFQCKLFRITDPVAQGVALGTSGHVIGTAKANEMSELTGAVSSLSLVVAGLMTAVLLPVLCGFL